MTARGRRDEPDTPATIDIRKLSFFTRMGQAATRGAAQNLSTMTGQEVEMAVVTTNFVPVASLPDEVSHDTRLGVRVRLEEPPHGHVMVLFPESSAKTMAAVMLSDVSDDLSSISGDMARSAIEELSNMMANGYVDGWADTLGTTVDVATPQLVYASGAELVTRTASLNNEHLALLFHSTVTVKSHGVTAELFALPDLEAFVRLTNDRDV